MEKMTLFQSLMKENKIKAAYLVARNEFYRKPGHSSNFEQYLEFCLKMGGEPVELETREFFIKEAEKALGHFADHTVMTEKVLKEIVNYRQSLVEAREHIENQLREEKIEARKRQIKENDKTLEQLVMIKEQIEKEKDPGKLKELFLMIKENEKKIKKEELGQRQELDYEALSGEIKNLTSKKKEAYNVSAIETFQQVLEQFKQKEEKKERIDFAIFKPLLTYDTDRLLTAAKHYYDFVYSYIFEHLDEDDKFQLTKLAIKKGSEK